MGKLISKLRLPTSSNGSTALELKSQELPPEIILDILECMWLSKQDLGTMRLLSKSFASLAGHVIFRSISIRIASDMDMGRLDFLSSPRIAQLVQTLQIHTAPGYPTRSPPALLGFFERLPQFTNIRTLHCTNLSLDAFALGRLICLKCLRNLQIVDCVIFAGIISDGTIDVCKMSFHSTETDPERAGGYARWLGVVNAVSMEDLRLSFSNQAIADEFLSCLATKRSLPLTHLVFPHDPSKPIPSPLGSQAYVTTVLAMQFAYIDSDSLEEIRARFPHLLELTLLIGKTEGISGDPSLGWVSPMSAYDARGLLSALMRFDFPPNIQRFHLNYLTKTLPNSIARDATEQMCLELKNQLFQRYPTLEWLQIDMFAQHMQWERVANQQSSSISFSGRTQHMPHFMQ